MSDEESQCVTSSSNLTFNPFEAESLDSMHLPAFSPSVFKRNEGTPCSNKKKGFRWSIDQMSLLYPADIDELPQQQESSILTKEKEQQVQEAINQFFSQKAVVPSPWSESRPVKHVTFSPNPPSVTVLSSAENSVSSHDGSIVSGVSGKVDASCQTAITLPLNFDLEAFLGKGRFQYTKCSVESFPVPPLRRKLFTPSESSSASCGSASPRSITSRESGPFSPSISPIKSSQELSPDEQVKGRVPQTPSSAESQFSSSPIDRRRTTPLRFSPHVPNQASPLFGTMESPVMSPIREVPRSANKSPDLSPIAGDQVSPQDAYRSPLDRSVRQSEKRMETSLADHSQLNSSIRQQQEEGEDFQQSSFRQEEDGEEGDFCLGLTKDLSPIQQSGDPSSLHGAPVCSSRLHATKEESIMETSLLSQKDVVRASSQDSPSNLTAENDHHYFSLGAGAGLSPIPKTGDLAMHQEVPVTPCRSQASNSGDGFRNQPFNPHKIVSFSMDTEFSPIRSTETGDLNSCQTVPITSSRVHEPQESLMDTSLFSQEQKNKAPSCVHPTKSVSLHSLEDHDPSSGVNKICHPQLGTHLRREKIDRHGKSGCVSSQEFPQTVYDSHGGNDHGDEQCTDTQDDGVIPQLGHEAVTSSYSTSHTHHSYDRESASWILDGKSSVTHGNHAERCSTASRVANRLTSTMRQGASLIDMSLDEGALNVTAMDISSVSMIASDIQTEAQKRFIQLSDKSLDIKCEHSDAGCDSMTKTGLNKCSQADMETINLVTSLNQQPVHHKATEEDREPANHKWTVTSTLSCEGHRGIAQPSSELPVGISQPSCDLRSRESSPTRPLAGILIHHGQNTPTDSGYNTNSANFAMSVDNVDTGS